MGSLRPRNSTRATNAHSVKRPSSHRRAPSRPRAQTNPRIPPAIEFAIEDQRDSLGTAISLLYCLHSALRRGTEDPGPVESKAIEDETRWADLTDVTAMLLVRLNDIHSALDSVSLRHADVDPERVALAEAVRKLQNESNAREAS
jgi:hypothetical protein